MRFVGEVFGDRNVPFARKSLGIAIAPVGVLLKSICRLYMDGIQSAEEFVWRDRPGVYTLSCPDHGNKRGWSSASKKLETPHRSQTSTKAYPKERNLEIVEYIRPPVPQKPTVSYVNFSKPKCPLRRSNFRAKRPHPIPACRTPSEEHEVLNYSIFDTELRGSYSQIFNDHVSACSRTALSPMVENACVERRHIYTQSPIQSEHSCADNSHSNRSKKPSNSFTTSRDNHTSGKLEPTPRPRRNSSLFHLVSDPRCSIGTSQVQREPNEEIKSNDSIKIGAGARFGNRNVLQPFNEHDFLYPLTAGISVEDHQFDKSNFSNNVQITTTFEHYCDLDETIINKLGPNLEREQNNPDNEYFNGTYWVCDDRNGAELENEDVQSLSSGNVDRRLNYDSKLREYRQSANSVADYYCSKNDDSIESLIISEEYSISDIDNSDGDSLNTGAVRNIKSSFGIRAFEDGTARDEENLVKYSDLSKSCIDYHGNIWADKNSDLSISHIDKPNTIINNCDSVQATMVDGCTSDTELRCVEYLNDLIIAKFEDLVLLDASMKLGRKTRSEYRLKLRGSYVNLVKAVSVDRIDFLSLYDDESSVSSSISEDRNSEGLNDSELFDRGSRPVDEVISRSGALEVARLFSRLNRGDGTSDDFLSGIHRRSSTSWEEGIDRSTN